jgi:dihydroorotase
VEADKLRSKSKNTPFGGYALKGAIMYTIVDGKAVVRQGVLID